MEPEEQIIRVAKRFEIAVSNFGRSCIDMDANEKAFQAWFASCVIQEFGISYVYREIHLWKKELFDLVPANDLTTKLQSGNELFPDVSVSWFPNIDARHSSTRDLGLKNPGIFLNEFSIVCELKVTGSTSKPTQPRQILNDIAKLYLFSAAHKKSSELVTDPYPLKCYMIILDNAKNGSGEFKKSYSTVKINNLLMDMDGIWEEYIPKPIIILISHEEHSAKVSILREFSEWITSA